MTERPLVSTILPVKNGEQFLADAIDSILEQDYEPIELLVVDGGSTDRSGEIARSYDEVTYLAQRDDGLAAAWNQGVAAASGELIAFLDSDDRWLPGKLEAQVELLERNPDVSAVTGLVRFVVPEGADPTPGLRTEAIDEDNPAPMPGTLLVRRDVFEQVGDFDTDYRVAMDVDWFIRVVDAGHQVETLDRLLLEKRFHGENLSHVHPAVYRKELLMAFRDSIARKRGAEAGG